MARWSENTWSTDVHNVLARTDSPQQLFVHVGVLIFAPITAAALHSSSDKLIDQDTCLVLPFFSFLSGPRKDNRDFLLCAAFGVGPCVHKGGLTEVVTKALSGAAYLGGQWGPYYDLAAVAVKERYHRRATTLCHDGVRTMISGTGHSLTSRMEDLRGPSSRTRAVFSGTQCQGQVVFERQHLPFPTAAAAEVSAQVGLKI